MATSARTAALRAQRNRYAKRKVLSPSSLSSSVSTTARRVADAEMDLMVAQYNSGYVSNEAFASYLDKALQNDVFTAADKVEMQKKLLEFNSKIKVEALEAVYENTQPKTQARMQAAQALASAYEEQANTMEQGTPAQSKALQEMGKWQNEATAEGDRVKKADRAYLRAQQFREIAELESGSVDEAKARSEAFKILGEQARDDGDETEALKYETQAANEMDKIPAIQERLDKKLETASRQERLDAMRDVQDRYHDGQLSPQQAAVLMRQIDDSALQAGDTSMQISINAFADKLNKDIEKGTTTGDIEGLPFMTRQTAGGATTKSIKEMKATFATEDDEFRKGQRLIARIPDALTRMEKTIQLYAMYMYGSLGDETDPEGWVGLEGRKQAYQHFIEINPKSQYTYENAMRDVDAKIQSLEPGLAKTINEFESVVGEIDQQKVIDMLAPVLDKLPEELRVPPGLENQFGIMMTTDKVGNVYEKVVPLNAEFTETDPVTGIQNVISTYEGRDVSMMRTDDGQVRYVKLKPYYATPEDKEFDIPTFQFAEFQGQLYVKQAGQAEPTLASEAAKKDQSVAAWYQTNMQREATLKQAYDQRRSAIEAQAKGVETTPAATAAATPKVEAPQLPVVQPKKVPVPEQTFQAPPETFNNKIVSPQQDLRLAQNLKLTPDATTKPAITPVTLPAAPEFRLADIQKQNQELNKLQLATPPQTSLQTSGVKVNLGNQYAPAIGTAPKQPSLASKISSTVGNVADYLKKKVKWPW